MYTLMEDPVILPNSKMSIDRDTIRTHLLSDPHDPFNRVPLKMEDVIPGKTLVAACAPNALLTLPDTALKARIDAFVREKTGKKAPEPMDTSAG